MNSIDKCPTKGFASSVRSLRVNWVGNFGQIWHISAWFFSFWVVSRHSPSQIKVSLSWYTENSRCNNFGGFSPFHLFIYFCHSGSKRRPAVWNPQIPTHGVATTDTAQRVSRQPGGELKGTGGVPFRASTGAWVCACVQTLRVFVAFLKWHKG